MLMPAPEQKTMNEPTIFFSHRTYDKLKNIDVDNPIRLLEVFSKTKANLSETFINFDATYKSTKGQNKRFNLHDGMNIILLFQDSKGNLFTTVRSYTVKKFNYYSFMRGKEYMISFDSNLKYDEDPNKMELPAPINNMY